jgi:hypothetical protein
VPGGRAPDAGAAPVATPWGAAHRGLGRVRRAGLPWTREGTPGTGLLWLGKGASGAKPPWPGAAARGSRWAWEGVPGRADRAQGGRVQRERKGGEIEEGELTMGLDGWQQALTGIHPRTGRVVERGGREGEGGYFAREIENEERARAWERAGAPGRSPRAGLGRGPGRLPSTRSVLLLIKINSRIENRN